jgi:UDP-N-acetylglucosamine--N-acetylmuramyl-(pentapeptide) pyrophosphoryl-undecaprenol N-acetylglucosamine transferase
VIAGGGTGGHLMPGLAVARALRAAGAERVEFVGTARGLEARLVPEAGFPLHLIRVGGLKTGSGLRKLVSAAQIPWAVWASLRLLRRLRAGVVFGIGGYASGPVLLAAALLRIPIVVLEVNARTGLANRWAARWVRTACVNFPETAADFPRARTVVTGIPVRPEFFAPASLPDTTKPLVLITGGSQGAAALNAAVRAMAPRVDFRILHQTGTRDFAATAAAYATLGDRVRVVAFLDDMAAAMAETSVLVSRSGASTLGELAAAAKPAVLVPYPGAADQHQLRNAEAFAAVGAAVLMQQSELTPEGLATTLEELLADAPRRTAMATAARSFAHPDAADEIATILLSHACGSRTQ